VRTELIITDDWQAYRGIADEDTRHKIINHKLKNVYAMTSIRMALRTSGSLLKRSINGTNHKLSTKHLDAYLDELKWRFNNRTNLYLVRDTLIKLLASENLEYKS
jgi:hypothetical protein